MIRKPIAIALVALFAGSSAALAAPTPWATPAGDHGSYTYSSGQTSNGNFGDGQTYSDGFYVLPGGLQATGAAGGPTHGEAADTLSVILTAKANQFFTRISTGLLGDFSIFGTGSVNSTGALRVTNLSTATTLSTPLAFTNTAPTSTTSFSNGFFNGKGGIDLPAGWTNIRVELDGFVSADASVGSSFIQAKDAEVSVETAQIPLPAAFVVAPIMALVGYKARRKLGLAK